MRRGLMGFLLYLVVFLSSYFQMRPAEKMEEIVAPAW